MRVVCSRQSAGSLPLSPPVPSASPHRPFNAGLFVFVWMLGLAAGFGGLMAYQTRAGVAAVSPTEWPSGTDLPFDARRFNLVLFAHPKCPCTRATLDELEVVLNRRREKIRATLCVFDPAGVPPDWAETSLVRMARGMPGVNVVVDRNGSMAAKFGAMTSGQVVMFDREGRRVFSGGITGSRGEAGENLGRNFLLALAGGEICGAAPTAVYGCALHEESEPLTEKR